MTKLLLILVVITVGVGIFVLAKLPSVQEGQILKIPTSQTPQAPQNPQTSMVAANLEVPWAIAFLPDGSFLVTERKGTVLWFAKQGAQNEVIATIFDVKQIGEGGLLGVAAHPDYPQNQFVYLYYTYSLTGNNTLNKVVRYRFVNKSLEGGTIIIDSIPGSSNHNGGRIKFGPDRYLYITTGDAGNPSSAQDTSTLAGKILRVADEGKVPADNPFNNFVYSYGHRNPQGLAWDSKGQLWSTEHGRSGAESGLDEVNLIEKGKNYGWPVIQGDQTREGMETPKLHSGPNTTWAPAGAAVLGESLFFAGLRGQTLYEVNIDGAQMSLKAHFPKEFGRLREVVLGPDNLLYITTSNKDGRGSPQAGDDKILRTGVP